MAVKAIACELPARLGLPLSRLHVPDIRAEVIPTVERRSVADFVEDHYRAEFFQLGLLALDVLTVAGRNARVTQNLAQPVLLMSH